METVENKYITLAYKICTQSKTEKKNSQKKLLQNTPSSSSPDWA